MTALEDLMLLSRDALLRVMAEQQQQIAELRAKVEALQAEVERLKRQGQRQAAPFAKGEGVAEPKEPGRKPGEGPFCYRVAPEVARVTRSPPLRCQ